MSIQSLHRAAALDQLARDLFVNHQEYLCQPVVPWPDVPFHLRQIYLELSARTLRMMCDESKGTTDDALFHLGNVLGRAEITTGLRPILGKVIGTIGVRG